MVGVLAVAVVAYLFAPTKDTTTAPGRNLVDGAPRAPEAPTTLATVPVSDPVDFTVVVQGIVQASNDLRVHPDPAGLLTFMESSDPVYSDALNAQSQLITGALRYDPSPATPTISKVRVIARDPDLAVVNVTFESIPRYRVVDRASSVVSDSPTTSGTNVQWKLHRTNGTWRLIGAQSI